MQTILIVLTIYGAKYLILLLMKGIIYLKNCYLKNPDHTENPVGASRPRRLMDLNLLILPVLFYIRCYIVNIIYPDTIGGIFCIFADFFNSS